MVTPSNTENNAPSFWQFVSAGDYKLPTEPVRLAARKNLRSLRQLFQPSNSENTSPLKADDDLQRLPNWQLERIAPSLEWQSAANELNAHLEKWLEQNTPDEPVIVLIGAPYSGHADVLAAWAEGQAWPVLQPPTYKQILAGDEGWLVDLKENADRWVFPHLEKAFLRHAAGLSIIRCFLDYAYSGKLGRGIIGCDSWAWSYLRHVWQGQQPNPLCLQAFHQEHFTTQFQNTANRGNGQQLLFRQSDNGRYVLPPPENKNDAVEMSDFLQLLAAYSRGNIGVAYSIWQSSLLSEPDDSLDENVSKEDRQLPHQTIWVPPWGRLKQPSLPPGAGRDQAFVLHALLLHGGLPFDLLQELLPLSPSRTAETVFQLKAAGLIASQDQGLQLLPAGYPAVRQFLMSSGYLVDQF